MLSLRTTTCAESSKDLLAETQSTQCVDGQYRLSHATHDLVPQTEHVPHSSAK